MKSVFFLAVSWLLFLRQCFMMELVVCNLPASASKMWEIEAWFLISLNRYTCLSYLSLTMLRYPGKYSLRKKEFFGSQFKIHSIMLGKLRDQDLEAASHMPHRVRKKKSMSV